MWLHDEIIISVIYYNKTRLKKATTDSTQFIYLRII